MAGQAKTRVEKVPQAPATTFDKLTDEAMKAEIARRTADLKEAQDAERDRSGRVADLARKAIAVPLWAALDRLCAAPGEPLEPGERGFVAELVVHLAKPGPRDTPAWVKARLEARVAVLKGRIEATPVPPEAPAGAVEGAPEASEPGSVTSPEVVTERVEVRVEVPRELSFEELQALLVGRLALARAQSTAGTKGAGAVAGVLEDALKASPELGLMTEGERLLATNLVPLMKNMAESQKRRLAHLEAQRQSGKNLPEPPLFG